MTRMFSTLFAATTTIAAIIITNGPATVDAFQVTTRSSKNIAFGGQSLSSPRPISPPTLLRQATGDESDNAGPENDIDTFLEENYSSFKTLLLKNEKVWKNIQKADEGGSTLFAPSNAVFENLGKEKLGQIADVRNGETAGKMAAYHVVNEPVTAEELFNSGGVITLGGEVLVDRKTSGGFFGFGGKEDGGVLIGGANVIKSVDVGNIIIHEVDSLISPNILWRYMDQLRIPGSK